MRTDAILEKSEALMQPKSTLEVIGKIFEGDVEKHCLTYWVYYMSGGTSSRVNTSGSSIYSSGDI